MEITSHMMHACEETSHTLMQYIGMRMPLHWMDDSNELYAYYYALCL
jgi:hypothetical protein